MATMPCPHCASNIQIEEGKPVRFCPFCGQTLGAAKEPSAPSKLQQLLEKEKKPKRKYEIIMDALAQNPDDFEANKALLYHGRLHEPMGMARGKGLDFSIIKSHLLSVFHTPDAYTPEVLDAKYEELLRGPQLAKVMALSPDPEAFFSEYIHKLGFDYIDLFIRGDSKYNSIAFGFGRSAESTARKCAEPVRGMLMEVARAGRLTDTERLLLTSALRVGFAQVFGGYAGFLDAC